MNEITKSQANKVITEAFLCKEIFGVDPGKSNGAVAKYTEERVETWNLNKMKSFEDMCDFWKYQKEICKLPLVILERITTYPVDADNIGRMFNMQKLKEHYTELRASMRTNQIPFIEVMPIVWQKTIKKHIQGEDYAIRKRRHKDIAEDIFPANKVTAINCDALLLIQFARHKIKYDQFWLREKIKEYTENNLFSQKK